jgi:hypothetical protein
VINQQLMAAGSWDLQLKPETPQSVLNQLTTANQFGHLIVTPTWVDPAGFTAAQLMALARYTGVYRRRSSDGLALSGAGLAIWLGDENDKGKLTQVAVNDTVTFGTWVNRILNPGGSYDLGNGLAAPSFETGLGNFTLRSLAGVTARTLLDMLCLKANAEWRVNMQLGRVETGTLTWLYPTQTTPTVVLTRDGGSRDMNIRGLPAVFDDDADVEDYSTGVHVHYNNDTALSVTTLTPPYKQLAGNNILMERVVTASDVTGATPAGQVGAGELAKTNAPRRQVQVSTDVYDPAADIQPGDSVWLHDPRLGYGNTANELEYRGRTIHPTKRRVYGLSWPWRQGMGAFLRLPDASGTVVDFTEWVVPEDGAASIEIGASNRSLLRARRRGEAA